MRSNIQKRIGILRGGTGKNYQSSIKKGGEILSYISENLGDVYKAIDILVDKDGIWHVNGVPLLPADIPSRVDLVWNTSLPEHSVMLQNISVPYLGKGFFHHVIEESKVLLREHMKKIGLPMPQSMVIPLYQEDFDGPRKLFAARKAREVLEKFGSPWIVKSFTEDKNMGIHLVKTFPELIDAIEDGVRHEKSILVEEFIEGRIGSVHSVPGFRGEDIYTFPLGNTFGTFSPEEKEKLATLAWELHQHMGTPHYLKSDFLLNPRGKVYLLQIESFPDLNPDSHFSEACGHAGTEMHHVVEHMLQEVLK